MHAECDRTWQIDAIRDGRLGLQDTESFERHRRVCASCTARVAANDRLGELARALACKDPTELELRRVRARVLRDTAESGIPRKKRRAGALSVSLASVFAVFLAAVLLAVFSVGARRKARAPLVASTAAPPATVALLGAPAARAASAPASAAEQAYAGSVVPSSDASWSQTRDDRLERVRLDVGTLIVHVRPQNADERFLVDLPDGELEVRGTTFAVTVRHGSTTRVRVDEGKVELRIAGQHTRALIANEVWPTPAVVPARTHHGATLLTRVVAPSPHLPPGTAVDTEAPRLSEDDTARYADAVRLLSAGKYDDAANAFHLFGAGRVPAAQAEDASYLEAVALARAGRLDAAALVAERYLDSFPESFHRKEAAILVARAARMRGDCVKARAALAPWRDGMPDAEAQNVLRMCF
jgi:TolA-binding protein